MSLRLFSSSFPPSKPTWAVPSSLPTCTIASCQSLSVQRRSDNWNNNHHRRRLQQQPRIPLPTPLFAVVGVADILSSTLDVTASASSCLFELASSSSITVADNIVEAVSSASSPSSSSSWRQYVPLVVSLGVIADILLGSPVANTVMAPLKGVQEELKQPQENSKNRRERVDSEAIAQQALNQAYASMELRDYLERNKSDEQRIQELRNKMDREMNQVDQILKERQAKLDAGEY